MKQLTTQQFQKAKNFVTTQARPLDKALFEYEFQNGSASAVLFELARFQNNDGGFGNALEPDFRLQKSSPIATAVAFQILTEVGASDSDEMLQKGVQYFISSYNSDEKRWRSVSKEVNNAPHAPWWHYNEDDDGNSVDSTGFGIPSAEIVGYLHQYSSLVPDKLLSEVTERAQQEVNVLPDDSFSPHVMLSYLRMVDNTPEPIKSAALEKLKKSAEISIASDPDWPGSGCELGWHAPSPKSHLAETFSGIMEGFLDGKIDAQAEDGSWLPNWTWAGMYEDVWEEAKRDWQGEITLNTLKLLRAYGRIEGM